MPRNSQSGITLIETIVFIVVISIALGTLLQVFNHNVVQSADPAMRIRALEQAQSLLDDILARKFDQNTPTGGVPACGSSAGLPCAGISPDGVYNDVGDFHGYTQAVAPGYNAVVSVTDAGSELGLANNHARRITVVVTTPGAAPFTLSAYRVNF